MVGLIYLIYLYTYSACIGNSKDFKSKRHSILYKDIFNANKLNVKLSHFDQCYTVAALSARRTYDIETNFMTHMI